MTTAFNIPAELRTLRQWVCSAADKCPKQVDGRNADVSKPETWNSFDACLAEAAKHKGWGVAFCFTTGDPYTVVDFDHVRKAESGDTESWALDIIDGLNSYTELSRSGTGWHVIVRSKRNALGKKTAHVEIYDHGKFVTLTGDVQPFVGSEEIFERDNEIAALQARLDTEAKPTAAPASGGKSESEEDFKLICKILDETKATNAQALAAEFAKRYPQRYEERNRVKKNRQGRPYIEYTALAVLRRLGLQPDPAAAEEKPGSGPDGDK
ncbi:MAG TPA: hypothetical protein VJQ50_02330, partial [Terriglobales bacterium]|nr:hypothetical protein [Terriglobales bacterium]